MKSSGHAKSIRMAGINGQDWLANIHNLHHMVRHPIRRHLLLDSRDKEQNCKLPSALPVHSLPSTQKVKQEESLMCYGIIARRTG
jgi:hypothetical protein